jgi:hypothetical protein
VVFRKRLCRDVSGRETCDITHEARPAQAGRRRQCDGAWSGHLTDTWRPEATAEHDRAGTDTWRLEAAERGRSTADTLADTPGGVSRLSATLFL